MCQSAVVSGSGTLWDDRVWRRFFAAHAVSITGTALTTVVLPIALYQRTGSAGLTALLAALQTVPYLLFGLFAGAIADRHDRRRIMLTADVLAALIVGSVPVADAFGVLTTPHLVVVAAGLATCFVWFDAANFGAVPSLVGRERVVRAVSAMWTYDSLALIVAPAVGAVIATSATPSIALAIDAVSYLASALLIRGIRRPFSTHPNAAGTDDTGDHVEHQTLRRTVAEGLHYLWEQRVLRALTLAGFGNSVSFGALLGLTVPYAVRQLGLSDHDARIGVLVAVGAVGALAAALALPRIAHGRTPPRVTTYALTGAAITMLAARVHDIVRRGLAHLAPVASRYRARDPERDHLPPDDGSRRAPQPRQCRGPHGRLGRSTVRRGARRDPGDGRQHACRHRRHGRSARHRGRDHGPYAASRPARPVDLAA